MIDPARLLALPFPEIVHSYTERDTILYALGVGVGHDPMDRAQLQYVYEPGLVALPSMAATLAYPGFWYRDFDTGLDFSRIVHGSERIVLHAPLPVAGTVVATARIVDVIDKGAGRGAVVVSERDIKDRADGRLLATVRQTAMCRGDGGFGGASRSEPRPAGPPERAPDQTMEWPTVPQAALIYRLSGDPNPLHADPDAARQAGFARPILHGLATMGAVCHAAVAKLFGHDPARLAEMECRFTAPVYPGDCIRVAFWAMPDGWIFRASVGSTVVASGTVSQNEGVR
jgi:acyl dehydratase